VRTVFSAHSSLGQVALPASCRGEVVLAFAPTWPEAGSDPRVLRITFRRDGDRIRLAGRGRWSRSRSVDDGAGSRYIRLDVCGTSLPTPWRTRHAS
jgi:alkylation response protein AidB-like acyl-CoA dehydrogenase